MRKTRFLCILCCLLLLPLLIGCAETAELPAAPTPSSAPTPSPSPAPSPSPSPVPAVFAGETVPWDTEELCLALREGETRLLDELPRLRRLDARESDCYEELFLWSQSHPEVETLYTVPVPGLGKTESGTESLDLTELNPAEILEAAPALRFLPALRELKLPGGGEGLELDQALEIAAALPETVIAYPFSLYGQEVDLSDTQLVFFHTPVYDQGEAVRRVLPFMRACTWLDMDSCGVDNAHMAVIRDENPGVEVIWRVRFGSGYTARTNVTKILASMPSQGGRIEDWNDEGLYYCTNVRYLDLGHNTTLTDFGFVRNMPDLEIAVISMAAIEDLSPFASCSHLCYLEMGNTHVRDLSPLAECKNLKHLNIGTNIDITDISPLYDLELKRLWIGSYTPIPEEQVEKMQQLHPGCIINTTAPSGLERDADGGAVNEGYCVGWKNYSLPVDWRGSQAIGWFKVVFKCFGYGRGDRSYAFLWNDPKFYGRDPFAAPVNVQVWDTSFLFEDWEDPHSLEPEDPDGPPGELLYELEH